MSHTSTPVQSVADLQARLQAERSATPFLVFRDQHGRQQIVRLDAESGELAIGRDTKADIALDWDRKVSRVHAVLRHTAGTWTIRDDGLSRNGTLVNGGRITGQRRLDDRDVIGCGSVVLEFRDPSPRHGVADTQQESSAAQAPDELTPAQRRVLVALCRPLRESTHGHPATNKTIAAELTLSVDAVKTHLRRLAVILGVEDLPQNRKRTELAWNALKTGLVTERDLLA
ncbi:MAG TPA: FHA domain-containing protein [Solirubrobacteraceae bacterium]|nr:FHA domain-containing protein [Solirubrobacteraceae bacterium]